MSLDKILVLFFGLLSIFFTYWFFFMKKEGIVEADESIDILVEGGYKPDRISIPYGKIAKLNFLRKDSNNCLEEIIISDFKIKKFLPVNEKISVEIKADKKGEFDFSCGMGMFHGKIIVK